ncbi:hypothetical protein [Fictibacillus barbaricus]|uniref:Uncharacterized protein YybS (DUF2232 family) n=1 Tax=Fictibacillus barbaricus TaxID=182136 RepID=A0ABU1TVM4_9BACL|nr:hypothetical protein [Fictibacillus barbaricus]MDR7071260.1 uncharacterized protein YybS (DUF2232 family) [Fictibacillus barbaricus]
MQEYGYTKTIGVTLGVLTIIVAIGFGILSLIGMSLSKALNGTQNSSSMDSSVLIVFCLLLLCGFITAFESHKLKYKAWKMFYTGFCLLLGIGFVIIFFVSLGALGSKNEIFILCMGIIYFVLSYLVRKKK